MDAKARSKLSESQVDAIARLLLSLPPIERLSAMSAAHNETTGAEQPFAIVGKSFEEGADSVVGAKVSSFFER